MPAVSILIPAYRPDYFDACVASALAQTHRDFELIVSDDCPGDDVERLLAKWDDPRIRYERNPTPRCYATNRDNLLRLAQGQYLKFLFDDDLLYPRSVQMLLEAVRSTGAKIAFHPRHFIDATGRVLGAPMAVPAGHVSRITAEGIYRQVIARAVNPIGEPSNILIEAEALHAITHPFEVEARPSRFLADVSMIYNFARAGHDIVGIGVFGSAFRQHAGQNSSEAAPGSAAGVFEWELLARSARGAQLISADDYRGAMTRVHDLYRHHRARHPVLDRFLELPAGESPEQALSARFYQTLDLAYFEVQARRTRPVAASPPQPPGAPA